MWCIYQDYLEDFYFWKHSSRLVIWGCFSIVSNVIWYNYCCRRHTMHGNMVFSTHYILGTPQQSGGFLVCSDKVVATFVPKKLSATFQQCLWRRCVLAGYMMVLGWRICEVCNIYNLIQLCKFFMYSNRFHPKLQVPGIHVTTCVFFWDVDKKWDSLELIMLFQTMFMVYQFASTVSMH